MELFLWVCLSTLLCVLRTTHCPPCPLQLVEEEVDGCNMWIMVEPTSMLQLSQRV